jgi:sortase A
VIHLKLIQLKRGLGICLILIGFLISASSFLQWQIGRSAAEDMTKEEIKKYLQEPETLQKEIQQSKPSSQKPTSNLQIEKELPKQQAISGPEKQTPSTDVKHEKGKKVALLVIPKIEQKYSVYWGTENNILKKGVGMFVSQWTTAPNGGGHTVVSGHRDTVFYRLDEMKEKDLLKLEYEDNVYTYQVTKIWVTDENDKSVIVKKATPTLTITTCYPFNYVGNATKRYIVQADLLNQQNNNKMLPHKKRIEY